MHKSQLLKEGIRHGASSHIVTPPTQIVPGLILQATDSRFVDITSWLSAIPETNNITVTVAGPVSMQVWGLYRPHTSAVGSRIYKKRELKSYLKAYTSGASVQDTYWTLSAKNAVGNTGSTLTLQVNFSITADPDLTITVSSRTYAGMGGFPLQRLGSATDWTLTSSTNNAFQVWDGGHATNARVAWAGASYLGARTEASPTLGNATYTATVQSTSLGLSRIIVFNVVDTMMDIKGLTTDTTTTQLTKVLTAGDAAGNLWYGDQIVCREGKFNNTPATTTMLIVPKQPTVKSGGPNPPTNSPYGTDLSPSWDYKDGWHPGWIVVKGDPQKPKLAQITRLGYNVATLTNQFAGVRWEGLNMNKEDSTTAGSIRMFDGSSSTRGVHGMAFDHCWNVAVASEEGDYSDHIFVTYNLCDQNEFDYAHINDSQSSAAFVGLIARDSQLIGNIGYNGIGDYFNGMVWNSVRGSGKTRVCFNVFIDKKTEQGFHADWFQPAANTAALYISEPNVIDIGYWIGNWCLKGRGRILTNSDVGAHDVFLQSATVVGTFNNGDVLTDGTIRAQIITKIDNRSFHCVLLTPDPVTAVTAVASFGRGATVWVESNPAVTGITNSSAAAWTSFTTGLPRGIDVGKTTSDCQGWFANAPAEPLTTTSRWRNVDHDYVIAGNIVEGLSGFGFYRIPRACPTSVFVNNTASFPWVISAELGSVGAYYEKGVMSDPSQPSSSPGWDQPNNSVISGSSFQAGTLVARNILFGQNGDMAAAPATVNNLLQQDFSGVNNHPTTLPSSVSTAFPNIGRHYDDVDDVITAWTPAGGSLPRTKGTVEIFGAVDTGMVDFRSHTFDLARLRAYA
jgi:hypothetical protein